MNRCDWSRLNQLPVGRFSEYLARIEFTLFGLDVCGSEVDDKGIDILVRAAPGRYYDVQVKLLRPPGYVYTRKDRFLLRPGNLLTLALWRQEVPPDLYLIPATAWLDPGPPFVDCDYEGRKSAPGRGLTVSGGTMMLLEQYRFASRVQRLLSLA